jgi:hypothetical protein
VAYIWATDWVLRVSIIDPTRRINLIRSELNSIRHESKINELDMGLIFLSKSGRVRSDSDQPDSTRLIIIFK